MSKKIRQQKILELIKAFEIDTQEELCEKLKELGFIVTQATVSRDIKELDIVKTSGQTKKYKYGIQAAQTQNDAGMFLLFKTSVTKVTCAQNLVVVKTISGNANAVAAAIEKLHIPEIIGCVAGDDTILFVASTVSDAEKIEEAMKSRL